jgi:L-fuconolactonase
MSLIDTHVHVWDPNRLRYEWLDGAPELNRPFLPADLDRGSCAVSHMLFVQADCAAAQSLAEAQWVASLAPTWPELAGIIAFAPIERGAAVADDLAALAAVERVVGIRRLLQSESQEFFERQAVVDGLTAVAHAGLTFDACVRFDQLAALVELRRRVPALVIVLDHLGKPPVADGLHSDAGVRWQRDLTALASEPLTVIKLSGLAPEASPDRPLPAQTAPFLQVALDLFGPDRALIGSDWPVSAQTPHRLSYSEWFDLVDAQLGLSSNDRAHIRSETARHVYGLPDE